MARTRARHPARCRRRPRRPPLVVGRRTGGRRGPRPWSGDRAATTRCGRRRRLAGEEQGEVAAVATRASRTARRPPMRSRRGHSRRLAGPPGSTTGTRTMPGRTETISPARRSAGIILLEMAWVRLLEVAWVRHSQRRRQRGVGGKLSPLWVDVQKLCNMCVHCSKCVSFCGTSYSRPPIDPYLETSPLLQNPGGATGHCNTVKSTRFDGRPRRPCNGATTVSHLSRSVSTDRTFLRSHF